MQPLPPGQLRVLEVFPLAELETCVLQLSARTHPHPKAYPNHRGNINRWSLCRTSTLGPSTHSVIGCIMAPQDVHILFSGTCECYLT